MNRLVKKIGEKLENNGSKILNSNQRKQAAAMAELLVAVHILKDVKLC